MRKRSVKGLLFAAAFMVAGSQMTAIEAQARDWEDKWEDKWEDRWDDDDDDDETLDIDDENNDKLDKMTKWIGVGIIAVILIIAVFVIVKLVGGVSFGKSKNTIISLAGSTIQYSRTPAS